MSVYGSGSSSGQLCGIIDIDSTAGVLSGVDPKLYVGSRPGTYAPSSGMFIILIIVLLSCNMFVLLCIRAAIAESIPIPAPSNSEGRGVGGRFERLNWGGGVKSEVSCPGVGNNPRALCPPPAEPPGTLALEAVGGESSGCSSSPSYTQSGWIESSGRPCLTRFPTAAAWVRKHALHGRPASL